MARRQWALFALATLAVACGGRSVRDGGGSDDDSTNGGVAGHGGASGGGRNGGTAGGISAGGGSTLGGSPGAGGVSAGGSPTTGGASAGGSPTTGGTSFGGSAGFGWDNCPELGETTISGTVRDPAGRLPLYNVLVYVPGGPLTPVAEGISCDPCANAPSSVLSAALSDTQGRFRLRAPSGTDVPVVIQIGRWRREVSVPLVRPCDDNLVEDPDAFRLPRSQSEGHLPKIAVTTGTEDSLECLLRRIGIDDSEFTPETGDGRVNVFVGCDGGTGTGANHLSPALGGAAFNPALRLFAIPPLLTRYDFVLLGCEGAPCASDKEPYVANLQRYADAGGRLMLDHLQSYWLDHGSPEWRGTAEYVMSGALPQPFTAKIDQTFPKGQALAEWLVNVGASTQVGEVPLYGAKGTVRAAIPPMQRWLYTDEAPDPDGRAVFSMTMNTPLDAQESERCGRVTFTNSHAHGPQQEISRADIGFPDGCRGGPLTPEEAAFAFQLFDVSSCIQSDIGPPLPPL